MGGTDTPTIDELLARATRRETFRPGDGKSAVRMERVELDGEPLVVKHLHVDDDWIARAFGDLVPRPLAAWRCGVLGRLPDCLDHAIVAVTEGEGRNGWGGALVMHDVSEWLVPEGDSTVPLEQHHRFLDHMAALHAHFWGFRDDGGQLLPYAHRWLPFIDAMTEIELARGTGGVPPIVRDGWLRFEEVAPTPIRDTVGALRRDIDPLVVALRATPATFLHGDWKLGNLGSRPDGRTILIDWQAPGEGPAAADLCWYLALNRSRLPESKEAAIAAYRASLTGHGVDAGGAWFDRQLALCQLGTLVQFGWEKALGDTDELAWWCERAMVGAGLL